jgi:hypothetical protein
MPLWKITEKRPSKVKETKFKQEKLRLGHFENKTVCLATMSQMKEVAEVIEVLYSRLQAFSFKS